MSKYIVSVGDIKGEYPCFAWFNTADLQEVIEIFSDVTVDEIKDYTLVLGSDILNEASWNERGEAYGEFVEPSYVLTAVDGVLQHQGLSIEALKCKVEVKECV